MVPTSENANSVVILMINYEGSIWRPPSEARSLILQATVGCSHNACIFCVSYKQKRFRIRGAEGIKSDLSGLSTAMKKRVRRVFLADGDALAMPIDDLLATLRVLRDELPDLERVGLYAYTKNVRDKSSDDLAALHDAGLGIVYLGLETGDNELMRWCRKGVTVQETIAACGKIREAGIPLSLTIILGLGGPGQSEKHAVATARALNAIDPEYVGALTLMTPPGTPIHDMVKSGAFVPMTPMDILRELRVLVEHLELSNCVFRTNHASNYLAIGGTMSAEKDGILAVIDHILETRDTSMFRPSSLRGL